MELQKEPVGDLQLHQVLRMNEGDGDNSYSNNSFLQKKVILQAKPILQETIVQLYSKSFPECITMADMGCSSGPNTFLPIWEVMEAIDESSRKLNRKNPILQVFLNDLPGNDFNFIFRSLPSFHKKLEEEMGGRFGPCFIAAMPGSFHGRLFPPRSLHFVHSSYSLHWLSEVQEIPLNKGNIYVAKTSPPGVHKAYLNQFEKDFTAFLRCRSEEMIPGGCMGLIEESKLDSFNLPIYVALAEEVKDVIRAERSFTITRLESFHVSWDSCIDDRCSMDKYTKGKYAAKQVRAITEAILARHFGDEIVDVMFQRFSIKIGEYMETFKGAFTTHVVSMIKA
ncbi:S-ADENOSYL-L-METHIONINE:CARBOXYL METHYLTRANSFERASE FAMILY PROTEIN [Salix viminalis]|uniref:S-ADENOSYL-L-METHIONINE:CARBOXYL METHYLTRANSFERASE FAMILY PROTEIN n=1 Tax=Salix viminalis TaxID=40686 RepID=A0A9Q0NHX2_SALVM|nr:S-ADENOSYL-L-METHIONINE:CARBOXYL METHYLTRANSFERASE FAMILY PROTEIN [Salix viminalis]